VGVETVQPDRYAPSLTLYGRVESLWSSTLTAALSADVLTVGVIEGYSVEQGALLVELDDRDARLQLLQREAELQEAAARVASEMTRHKTNLEALPRERRLLALTRNELGRVEGLVAKKVGSQSQLDAARQALERQAIALASRQQAIDEHESRLAEVEARRARAAALRDQAQLELERCRIRAPFDGRISAVRVSPGKRVRAGDPLLEIYDTGALVLRAQIPSRYLPIVNSALQDGQTLQVKGAIDGVPVTAALRSLAGEAAAGTGGVEGLFEISGSPLVLQQGRFTRLDLKLPAQNDLVAVPHEAIYGTDRVYLMGSGGRMRALTVDRVGELRTGKNRSRVLIRSDGLRPGVKLITTQLPNAVEGLLVRVAGQD
jgi:RND family efflux transporter MFP subunit